MANDGMPQHPLAEDGAGTYKKAEQYSNYANDDGVVWLQIGGTYRRWRAPSPAAVSRVQHAFAYRDRFDVFGYDTGADEIELVRIQSK